MKIENQFRLINGTLQIDENQKMAMETCGNISALTTCLGKIGIEPQLLLSSDMAMAFTSFVKSIYF